MKEKKQLRIQKRSREEVIAALKKNTGVWREFQRFPSEHQEELILFCMGNKGLRITCDKVFKRIYDPELHRDRLEDLISIVLGKTIRIVRVLQREGIQLKEQGTFVVMDVVVQLEDGTLLNVEMQKIGYRFPVERTDCYLADLLMRQYHDRQKDKKFSYKDMSKVVSIVIMEKSSEVFRQEKKHYIHHGKMKYDTGISLNDLFENTYICLDTYKKFIHTKISSKKEAWMLFLASDKMEDIMEVCRAYPEFIPLYEEVFEFSNDVEELVTMFSDELRAMDRNEERYMVEELQEELKAERERLIKAIAEERKKAAELLAEEKEKAAGLLAEEKEKAAELLAEEKEKAAELLAEEKEKAAGLLAEEKEKAAELLAEEKEKAAGLLAEEKENAAKKLAEEKKNAAEKLAEEKENMEKELAEEREKTAKVLAEKERMIEQMSKKIAELETVEKK